MIDIEEVWKNLDSDDKWLIYKTIGAICIMMFLVFGISSCARNERDKTACLDEIAETFCEAQGHTLIDLHNGINTFNCIDKETRAISDNYKWSEDERVRCRQ